jgi:tRNA U34 5-carboxymethylaminomethyl modifying GTPase MnmE/TrmE
MTAMSDADLRAEIEALRREIAGLRAERKTTIDPEEDVVESAADNLMDQMRILAQEISAFAEETEKGVVNHPLTSVLGALVLGVLIGRMFHR